MTIFSTFGIQRAQYFKQKDSLKWIFTKEWYFNTAFKDRKVNYNFNNLKLGFFYGNNGSRSQTKKQYFDLVKNRLGNCSSASNDLVIELTNEEKTESGGYDLIIVSWSKIIPTHKSKARMIKELKNKK